MNRARRLVFNTALLTASSLLIRCIAMVWQVWLVSRIGSAGIGLFTLVVSVGGLAATFAISGIRFTSTRLISEELGLGNHGGVAAAVTRCCAFALFFGVAAMLILYLCAEPIGFLWIGDARTVLSLEIFAFGLPFISLSSVLGGYFTSTGRVYKSAGAQFIEEVIQVALTVLFLRAVPTGDLERSCAAVVAGSTVAQMLSFALLCALYLGDRRRYRGGPSGGRLTRRMLHIAMPLALSAYTRTSLTTLQQMLVPRGLRKAGFSADKALSDYGIIQGMAFPVVAFPACFLMALSEMLVPELTEAQVAGHTGHISRLTSRLLERCILFSFGVASVMYTFSHELGVAIFSSDAAGKYIGIFALLVPVIYMDLITDGCLKGLGEMLYSMGINIADAFISVVLVIILLPKYGLPGYLFVIFATELFNFALSLMRLMSKVKLEISARRCITALLCAVAASQGVRLFMNLKGIAYPSLLITIAALAAAALAYVLLLPLCGCVGFHKKVRES